MRFALVGEGGGDLGLSGEGRNAGNDEEDGIGVRVVSMMRDPGFEQAVSVDVLVDARESMETNERCWEHSHEPLE